MIINTEKFIEVVRQHSILYDMTNKEYKNLKKKDKIWDNISKIVGGNGTALKKKWKNLRDSYGKYLRSEMPHMEKNVNVINRYKSWPWAIHMEFLRPFLQFSRTIDAETEIIEVNSNSEDEIKTENQLEGSPQKSVSTKRSISRKSNGKRKCEDTSPSSSTTSGKYLQKPNINSILASDDDIDIIFMGYAKTLKKFSPRRQTIVKFKFSQILMEEELAQQEENEQTIT